jgi:thioredoxin-dependent peroxiredoxin
LQALGAEVVGVSTDDRQTQCDFASKMAVTFPMIGDQQGELAWKYDVYWPFMKLVRRVTFLIDEERTVRGIFRHELRIGRHVDDVLVALRALRKKAPATP